MAEVTDRPTRFLGTDLDSGRVRNRLTVCSTLVKETRDTVVRVLVEAVEELCDWGLEPFVSESGLRRALSGVAGTGLIEGHKNGRWKKNRAIRRAGAPLTILDGGVHDD